MLRLEEEKKKKLPVDEFEKEKQDKRKMVNNRAVEYNNEHIDEVKEMNKMVAYAKVATIRERQLEEKKNEWEHFKEKEKKKDLIMEVERLRKIEEQDEIEERKKREALIGKEVIIDQIKKREIDRLKAKEEQEREAQILVQKMKELEKEEQKKVLVNFFLFLEKERRTTQNQ